MYLDGEKHSLSFNCPLSFSPSSAPQHSSRSWEWRNCQRAFSDHDSIPGGSEFWLFIWARKLEGPTRSQGIFSLRHELHLFPCPVMEVWHSHSTGPLSLPHIPCQTCPLEQSPLSPLPYSRPGNCRSRSLSSIGFFSLMSHWGYLVS